jgi:hypothetical protein
MGSACSTRGRQKFTTTLVWKTDGKAPNVGSRIRWKNNSETNPVR